MKNYNTQDLSEDLSKTKVANNYFTELKEDKDDYDLAMAALKEYKESGEKTVSSDEARKMLGL